MYKKSGAGVLGVIITTIILIIIVIITNINMKEKDYVGNAVNNLVMPIQNGLTYLKNKIEGNTAFFYDINSLKTENEELKEKNKNLEETQREIDIMKAENTSLKEYLNLTERYSSYTTVAANVINREISNYDKVIVINAGSREKIEVGMPVISDKGLVGKIISVTNNTAKVQTIIDPSSMVSSSISTTRDTIICKGTIESDTNLKAVYIPTEANLADGDTVETSGMGGIFPKGIVIGQIDSIVNTKNILDRYANIKTTVDFSKLETVLIITNFK